ncbi:MAG TPA: trimethylamine methyltransferase family protein [Thermodesulfobacteriota bacterium]|nr:trimethylamine methyltransferase family protein [Thermodesulfobacteriota bacterium]
MEGFLARDKIREINESSLGILSEVGIRITHPEVRRLLLDSGGKEGKDSAVLFPRTLISESLHQAPEAVRFADLQGNLLEVRQGSPPLFWSGNALFYVRGTQRQELTRDLYVEFCKVAHHLPHLHAIVGTSLSDYPPPARDFVGFRAMAENTQKHLRPVIFTPKGVEVILEMAEVLLKGKSLREHPIFSLGFTCVSPLRWSDSALEVFRVSSGYGIPLMINSEVISGATGPVTLAGTLALANAEAMSGVAIAQLLEPGRPIVFNVGFSHIFDMRVVETLTGSPEGGLIGAAGNALARFHGLPSASWASTESKIPDAQASYEKTLLGLLHTLGGVNLIWGIGNLDATLAISPEQAVIDNEITAGLLRAWKGIEVDEARMAVSVIRELAQKADYLGHEHTLSHFREELLVTKLLSRERWALWEKGGRQSLTERAADQVQSILKGPPPEHLSGTQRERLAAIEKRWLEKV